MKKRSEARAEKRGEDTAQEEVPLFQTAHSKVKLPSGYAAIVERIFVETPEEDYAHLEEKLSITETVTYSVLMEHLNKAEDNARLAFRLYLAAKVEREKYEIDMQIVDAAMRDEAVKMLQAEKDNGTRNKAITDADVVATMAQHHPEEWKSTALARAKVKAMVDALEDLATEWKSRCRSLSTMLTALRK